MKSNIRCQYYGLDVAKLIASILVIGSHTHPLSGLEGTFLYTVYLFFNHMSVPLFAITSGYLLAQKLQWVGDPKDDLNTIKKTMLTMLRLYLIWTLIYLPIAMQEPIVSSKPFYLVLARYVINFFFVGEHYLSWHLWYLLACIYGLIVLMLLRKWNCKTWMLGLSSLVILYFSYWLYGFVELSNLYSGFLSTLSALLGEIFINGRLFTGISYLLTGAFLGRLSRLPKPSLCFISLLAGFFLNSQQVVQNGGFLPYVLVPACTACLLLLCLQWKGSQPSRLCLACRDASTVFYFTHMLWYYIGYILLGPLPSFTYWGTPSFFWCLMVSIIAAIAVIRFQDSKVVKFLF